MLVDDAPDSTSARHFMQPSPCALLVTRRERITLDTQTRVLDIGVLTDTQSQDFLLHLAPRLTDDAHTADLLGRCANLPLALRIVGDTLRERSDLDTTRYLARLTDETHRFGALKHDDRDVYAILGASDTLLAERDAALAERWRMLHVCPAPFDRAVIAALWGEPDDDALDDALGELLRRSLLDYNPTTQHYSLHDLLRDVARQRCSTELADIAHERHATFFCGVANAADALYLKGGEQVLRGLSLFDAALLHIAAGQAWATGRAGAEQIAIMYAVLSPSMLYLRLHPHSQITWLEAARAASQTIGNCENEGAALGNLGIAYQLLGEVERAIGYYEQQLELARAIGDNAMKGLALGNLGTANFSLGKVTQAIGFYEQWIEIAQTISDRAGKASASWNLGVVRELQGDYEQAAALMQYQIKYMRELGHPHTERYTSHVERLRKAQAKAALPESLQRTITPFNREAFAAVWAALPANEQTRLTPLLAILGIPDADENGAAA